MTYKFDEKMFVVGDVYLLQKFKNDAAGHSIVEHVCGILESYEPKRLIFTTLNGPIIYDADIQLDDHYTKWSPCTRIDVIGNKYDIMMGGLSANTDIIDDNFNIGNAYFIKTPNNWVMNDFYGIYTGYDAEDLWKWPTLNFMAYQSKSVDIKFVDILRGNVKICDLSDHSKIITFNEEIDE